MQIQSYNNKNISLQQRMIDFVRREVKRAAMRFGRIRRGAVLLSLLVMTLGLQQANAIVVRTPPPPPRRSRAMFRAPRHGMVWTPGFYGWRGGRYTWMPGRWAVPPRRGAMWVAPRWRRTRGGYAFVAGRWR
jgi:hypothetical protein